jgi:MYXO-CTERM domain-containing protein
MIVFNHLASLPDHEQVRSQWDPVAKSCVTTNVEICQVAMVSGLVTDAILLLMMLAGLLQLRRRGGGSYELWHLLWKQVGH